MYGSGRRSAFALLTPLEVIGWGWFYLSTVLDDFSHYILDWKLCPTMKAEDITEMLELALQASGLNAMEVRTNSGCSQTMTRATSRRTWPPGWRVRA
jgi:transposase InsO family protein